MEKKKPKKPCGQDLRLDPERRLCAKFDAASIAKFRAPIEEMGVRVLDNCAEEHMM